ncbi:MAG: radical SAM family heme chaperone HemW [Anaerocolumna sp.]
MLNGQKKDLGLYIHIPFCVRKCDYCDFLSAPADEDTKNKYVKALIAEIKSYKLIGAEYLVKTIFIGGGTPSSLEGEAVADIMKAVRKVFTISDVEEDKTEITIEVNPGTISREKLYIYKSAGINRLSFGLQSVDNRELRLLGRIHTYETFEDNYKLARELGFLNINIDLMSGLPGQTLKEWLKTLEKVIALRPEHISAYSLMIEEETPFYDRYGEGELDEELDREIYAKTKKYLEDAGYNRYEISNFAKEGFACRHNTAYWTGKEYLGLGLGASSLLKHMRFHNEENMASYLILSKKYMDIRKEAKRLTRKEQMEEFMFLGLRMCAGVRKDEFNRRFGQSIQAIYGDIIKRSETEGLLKEKMGKLYLTDKGIDVSNMVMSRFLLD